MAYMDNLGGGYGVLEDCRTDQTQVVNWFATDTYKEICQLHYEWAQEGLIMPDASSNAEPANTLIAAGTAFGYFHNNKPGIENEDKNATGKDMTMIPIIDAYSTTSNVSNCWMIPYQSEKTGTCPSSFEGKCIPTLNWRTWLLMGWRENIGSMWTRQRG